MTPVPRPRARVEAHEQVEIELTVNGSTVSVAVPPRMHLADALRDRIGLTGTHLGCEHGVCGMCTVMVDGVAARACLLFAVQCEGSDVVTVEGLGSVDEQHPLQRAFAAHHALQCGFCTPGMLMSSYDLLTNGPAGTSVAPADLPVEMSGVICRCTGYRGILDAVADVAKAYPDGLPEPRNRTPRRLLGRTGRTQHSVEPPGGEPAPAPADVRLPGGAPTATVEVRSTLAAPVEAVWRVLDDFECLASCLPGARLVAVLSEDRYRGRAVVALGPVKLSFDGIAQVVDRDADEHRLRVLAHGADAGGSATQADIRLTASSDGDGDGTLLSADAALFLTGRIAQFGRALAGDVSRRMFEQFAASVERAATTGEAPEPVSAPSPLRILLGVLADRLRRLRHRA